MEITASRIPIKTATLKSITENRKPIVFKALAVLNTIITAIVKIAPKPNASYNEVLGKKTILTIGISYNGMKIMKSINSHHFVFQPQNDIANAST